MEKVLNIIVKFNLKNLTFWKEIRHTIPPIRLNKNNYA